MEIGVKNEVKELDKLATKVIIYLVIVFLVFFVLGSLLLDTTGRLPWAVGFIGISGSAVAALTSCLDRYAAGFELEEGEKIPEEPKGGTFNRRMSRWFFVRPLLGFVVAPVFIWGQFSLPKNLNSTQPLMNFDDQNR